MGSHRQICTLEAVCHQSMQARFFATPCFFFPRSLPPPLFTQEPAIVRA